MKAAFFALAAVVLLAGSTQAFAFGGCEQDCQKCHSLSKEDASDVLGKLKMTDSRVVDIRMSPVGGLWEISVEEKTGRRKIVYLGFSKKYVVNGPIIDVETASNKTKEKLEVINKPPERYVNTAGIPLEDALLLGSTRADKKVIVFTDPD